VERKQVVKKQGILIVDHNEAFAEMLREGIQDETAHPARVVGTAHEALRSLDKNDFVLLILDSDLPDMRVSDLIRAVRQKRPEQRIMVIPLFGQELDAEAAQADIQGVLPKPFFRGDLADLIARALSAPPPRPPAPSPAAEEPIPPPLPKAEPQPSTTISLTVRLQGEKERLLPILTALQREIKADDVLFTGSEGLICHTGQSRGSDVDSLVRTLLQSFAATTQVAQLLGIEQFEQSLLEAENCRLYALNLSDGLALSVIFRSNVPAGMVRYHTRRAAGELIKFIGTLPL